MQNIDGFMVALIPIWFFKKRKTPFEFFRYEYCFLRRLLMFNVPFYYLWTLSNSFGKREKKFSIIFYYNLLSYDFRSVNTNTSYLLICAMWYDILHLYGSYFILQKEKYSTMKRDWKIWSNFSLQKIWLKKTDLRKKSKTFLWGKKIGLFNFINSLWFSTTLLYFWKKFRIGFWKYSVKFWRMIVWIQQIRICCSEI